MTTRAATFTSKIRNLKDYRFRIINNLTPQPTGIEIENTLKYFSQTLLSVLKDVPNIPAESYGPRQRDSVRLSVFPNLNYTGLFYAVLNMIDILPTMQVKLLEIGENMLKVLGCLVPFLEHDLLDSLPYTVASTLAIFPPTLHKDTIDLLCSNLLPMTLGFDGCFEPSYASESAAAIITTVLQHTDNGSFHSQILECFMSIKRDIIKDLLSIVAYGPPTARSPAANLLFYYWPQLNPSLSDRRGIHYKYTAWPPVLCQRRGCVNSGNCQAVKMCLNPALAIHSGDKPPPLYICSDCADDLRKDHSEYMTDILLPMSHVSTLCENKNCRSGENMAICTCFSIECASFNGNRPIRYCHHCHEQRHNTQRGQRHVYHLSIPEIWDCNMEMQRYLMDAIISLLKEAQPIESKRMLEMGEDHQHFNDDEELFLMEEAGERKLLSRYGIWLLVELCATKDDIPIEILGRLLGMLFQWFDATAYLPDDNVGSALERLKGEYIYDWLEEVAKTHFEVIVSCLLPHPVEYARVGGFWDTLCSRTTQIKEGLNCFFCLVPYDVITFEIWDYVMPYWLESIRTEVPTEDLHELKVLLNKSFDIDLCPLPFGMESEKMYHFISERFNDNSAYVQEQALQWLQILSTLDIYIPIHMLLSMFTYGVQNLTSLLHQQGDEPTTKQEGEETTHKPAFSPGTPVEECPPPLSPSKTHVVVEAYEIYDRETELVLPCYIMMLDLVLKQLELQNFPKYLGLYNETSKQIMQLLSLMLASEWDGTHVCGDDQQGNSCNFCQNIALWHQVTSQVMQNFCPLNQVKIPTKEIPRIDESKRLSATPKSRKNSGTSNDDAESTVEEKEEDASFDMTLMPLHLQLYHSFLLALEKTKDTDASFSLLMSMKYLILNGECLNYTVSQYPDYVKYSLSKLLIPNLWSLLQAKNSQQASVGVPLLLHCLTLPTGADVLWKLVEEDFSSENWKVRFAAVEKVTVFARLLEADSILHNQVIQTVLAHAFSLLVGSMEDINSSVSQQAIQYLETIRSVAIKGLCQCLEFQFDHVISDRIMILQRMHLLSNILPDLKILSWEFFLARFDALSLEAQLDLENSDLTSSDRDSEHFLRKLNRARFALARTESIRSLSKGIKPPYRRAVSVPMHLISKTTPPKVEQLKEKSCIRQQSAPHFNLGRRMTSKMQFGAFGNIFPGSQIKEFTDEESNFTALLQKAMDMEGVDKDTVYQLVALLMKYMVTSNLHQGAKKDTKTQNIVLRHLNVLLGYNQTEKSFSVPPHKLRASAVFNAFLSGVPFVLDRNFELGNQILPITLLLLQYGPSPQRYASDYQPPNYTLWYLEPHTRISWLTTLLVIIYKYQFYTSPVSAIIQTLVRVVINTIDAQHHTCKKSHEDGFVPPSPSILRSKDSVKLNDLENIQETETPPQSPKVKDMVEVNLKSPTDGSTVQYIRNDKLGRISTIKEQSVDEIAETPRRPSRPSRKPRRLVEYTEPDHGKIDRDSSQKKQKESTKTDTEDVKSKSDRSPSPAKIETTPASESKSPDHGFNVDSIIAKQLHELSIKGDKSTGTHEPPLKGDKSAGLKYQSSSSTTTGTGSDISKITSPTLTKVTHMGSSITTDTSSTRTGITSTTDMSRDGTSEAESAAEDSEKTQTTSDADSEKQTGATDSGDADTQEEGKGGDTIQKSGRSHGMKPNFRQRKARKTGLTTIELQKIFPELNETVQEENGGRLTGKRARKSELLTKSKATKKPFSCRYGDNVMVERCPECSAILEQYDEDTIGYCVIVLATFIHREPSLATPLLLETLQCVSRIASSSPYVWQTDSNMMIPGNSISIARQFLRCVLHQLSPNGIFPMLFQSSFKDVNFFKTMAVALVDFPELTCHAPIQFLLEGLNGKKNLPSENIMLLLNNLATYMNCISLETSAPMWSSIIGNFDIFLRKLAAVLPNPCDTTSLLKIMTAILKVTGISASRSILEPFSKLMSFIIQNCSFKLQQVLDICSLCNRVFSKERDKLYLTRTVIFELVQAVKFKNGLPDENFLLLVQFVVLDSGGTIGSTNIVSDVMLLYNNQSQILLSTCAAECMRDHLHECTEFVADLHTLTKIKNNMKGGGSNSLNEDTLGNQLKSGIAQFVALEITRGNGRDNRGISRYLPWLYHPPSTVQQGPKEFTDCIGHIRLLSWLLIGSLTHTAMTEGTAPITCQPIPLDATSYISEHVLVIMTGFDERSKDSVLHMSSLFHAFILCQLWTMYCESAAAQFPVYSENHKAASNMVMDFWGRVTPGILQMLNTPKELAEMVNLHFLSLMEALRECNSTVLAKLFPMWTSILFTHHSQLPGHLQVRLQTVENWEPPSSSKDQASFNAAVLLSWLKRIQFKLGQIEVQSSAATQFYTV